MEPKKGEARRGAHPLLWPRLQEEPPQYTVTASLLLPATAAAVYERCPVRCPPHHSSSFCST